MWGLCEIGQIKYQFGTKLIQYYVKFIILIFEENSRSFRTAV